jgi:MFS superfamily sulfate permease-like transporter
VTSVKPPRIAFCRENLMAEFWNKLTNRPWVSDFLASMVVFLVALPLCMGIAIACGAPPAAGLITGIIGGLLVGFLSGCPLQVSGPAAGLVVVVSDIISSHGLATLGVILVVAGLIQMAAGALRIGVWFTKVSPAVVAGMLSGIGVLIMASQFHIMLDSTPQTGGIENLLAIPASLLALFSHGSTAHIPGIIGAVTICVMMFWSALPWQQLRMVPAPLAAVVISSVATALFGLQINMVALPDSLMDAVSVPSLASFWSLDGGLLLSALTLAIIASAETLLTATAVDAMQSGPRTNYNRELLAQGVGNLTCGLLGALPMTGVIVRSGANVQAGAKTRASAIMHGAWLLAIVCTLPWLLKFIPIASLAAVLVFTGFKLLNLKAVKELKEKGGYAEVCVYLCTLILVVCIDLLTGVIAGQLLAIAVLLTKRWLAAKP